jgi:hypothetical protein
MRQKTTWTGIALLAMPVVLFAQSARPPVPLEILDFPAQDLFEASQNGNVVRMRRHAWQIFAGLTAPTPGGVPLFRTWARKADLFPVGTSAPNELAELLGMERPTKLPYDVQTQDSSDAGIRGEDTLLRQVFYNNVLFQEIVKKGWNCNGIMKDRLAGSLRLQVEDRRIPAVPVESVAVKTEWLLIPDGELTPVPVWDPGENATRPKHDNDPFGPIPRRWSRWVAVDTRRGPAEGLEFVEMRANGPVEHMRVVPIRKFHWIRIETAQQAAHIRSQLGANGKSVARGSYLVLVGLHFTTKEIPDWVWGTFWWHDEPDRGPFVAQRPGNILGAWRNYLMEVAYSMKEPREADGSPHIAFNPYLEARMVGGITSNCMTCHRQARWPEEPGGDATVRGEISPADSRFFGSNLKLDFLWTLATTHRTDPKSCDTATGGWPGYVPSARPE